MQNKVERMNKAKSCSMKRLKTGKIYQDKKETRHR